LAQKAGKGNRMVMLWRDLRSLRGCHAAAELDVV
jgi:hypothetical protein